MKVNFFGTDIFASIILQGLVDAGFCISCVVTKPDVEIGRKRELIESKVSLLAKNLNIPVLKPSKLKDFEKELVKFNGDINIVCEYGKIIPDSVLYLPKFKSVNIHGSILPKYRGASPIQFALINGDFETGVTLMEMDHEMDHGNIINIAKCDIEKNDIEPILRKKLANIGLEVLLKELNFVKENKKFSNSIKQDHMEATYTRFINKQDGFLDCLIDDSLTFINKFKAFIKWPGIFIVYRDKRLKLNDIDLDVFSFDFEKNESILPFVVKDKNLFIVCADKKLIKINKLQFESKNEITSKDFINQINKH